MSPIVARMRMGGGMLLFLATRFELRCILCLGMPLANQESTNKL